MSESKLLSIVIPAYNMEKYLQRCLDSILVESVMGRVQVLVINDGSRDKTSKIAHEYESKYPHYIQVIDKENGNYGSCMNVGLSLAEGKYFRTLDADDWYDTVNYQKFVDTLQETEADMLVCERFVFYEGKNELVKEVFEGNINTNNDIFLDDSLWSNKSLVNLNNVNCICYKTSILKDNGFNWTEDVFYSDTEYDYFPLYHVNTIRCITLPVYCYYFGRADQSVSMVSVRKNFNSFYKVSERILFDYIKFSKKDHAYHFLQRHHLERILWLFYLTLLFDGFKYRKEINEIEKLVIQSPELYKKTSLFLYYRNFLFVDSYRHNKIKFCLERFDYLIRSNSIINSIFR